jgi:CRISPR system Cascade subunit CasA
VRTGTGAVRDASLTDLLLGARHYRALAETSPPNLIALHRLLLAVMHRALTSHYGTWKDADRARWYREGLPEEAIRAYLDQWRERFWLFHPEVPFMQVAALADAPETRDRFKPWTQIALDAANGNAPVMFDHAVDEAPRAIGCNLACRHLLGALQFVPGGLIKALRSSDKAGPLANTAAILPTGATLAETLCLGLHPPAPAGTEDLPAWEKNPPSIAELMGGATLATGPNDRYTRQTRAVLLLRDGPGQIRRIHYAAGIALEEAPSAPEPMAGYRLNKDGEPIRLSFAEGRAIWRDLPVLVPDPTGKLNKPPTILLGATSLMDRMGRFDAHIQVLAAGISSKEAKLLRWRADQVELPLPLLANPDSALELRRRMRSADDCHYRLRELAVRMVAASMPDPEHKDTKSRARDLVSAGPMTPAFYSSLEQAFPRLLHAIAAGDLDGAHRDWTDAIKRAAERAWAAARRCLGTSPAALRAEARTWPRFHALLRTLTEQDTAPTPEEATS